MPGFFGMPSRGGKLTILNCLLWAIVIFGGAIHLPMSWLPALVVCWPLAWLFLLPALGGGGADPFVMIMIGVNSFLWGYGLSWLISMAEKRNRAGDPRRGFDVTMPSTGDPPTEG